MRERERAFSFCLQIVLLSLLVPKGIYLGVKKEERGEKRKRKEEITANKRPGGHNYRNTAGSALAGKLQPFHRGSKAILFYFKVDPSPSKGLITGLPTCCVHRLQFHLFINHASK